MVSTRPIFVVLVVNCLLFCLTLFAQINKLAPTEAANHVREKATVRGPVASAKFPAVSKCNPTFTNSDRQYPSHVFTAPITGDDRPNLGSPEGVFLGNKFCVSGTISSYRVVAEVVVCNRSQRTAQG